MSQILSYTKFEELSNPQKVNNFIENVNNLTAKNLSYVKQITPIIVGLYEADLALMGKRAMVVDLHNIAHVTDLGQVKFKLEALVKAISNLTGKGTKDSGFSAEAIQKEALAYKRKTMLIRAIEALISSGSLDEGELKITQELLSKNIVVRQSIEINILSKYAAGVGRTEYDKHFVINEHITKILSIITKGGN